MSKNTSITCTDTMESPCVQVCPHVLFIKPEGPFIYVNAENMRDEILEKVASHPGVKSLILDMGAVYTIDASGTDALKDLLDEMNMKDIKVKVTRLDEDVLRAIEASGLKDQIEVDLTKKDALSKAMKALNESVCKECNKDVFEECKKEVS